MLKALEPYGPEGHLAWSDQRIALGVNLRSSLPERRFDKQPIWSPDGSICLVADVRLDNRADLARELGLTGNDELADSAFLMSAWLRWGSACLDHLIGGFAFAVWTPAKQEVFAARDHAGERPLLYHQGKHFFALASMYKGLLTLPMSQELREPYAADWIGCLKPEWSSTFYKDISRLPPGHFLRVTPGGVSVIQYWHPANAKPIRFRTDEQYAEALLDIFDRATEARLRSTNPIGSFLSAGLDSSSVTASAARLLATDGKQLTAFTSVPRPGFNGAAPLGFFPSESEGAAAVAGRYSNIEHIIVDSRGYDLLQIMRRWVDALDEPTPAAVNLLWLTASFDQAKQRDIRVMLEGAEGNLTFSYNTWTPLTGYFRRARWIALARTIQGLNRTGALTRRSAVRLTLESLVPRSLRRMRVPQSSRDSLLACLASPALMGRYNMAQRVFDTFHPSFRTATEEHYWLFEGFDQGPYHAAVEAVNGVELRDPTADKRLYEFSFAIPPEQYLVGGHSRSLARRAMKDRLPESTLFNYLRGLQGADWYSIMGESLQQLRDEVALMHRSLAALEVLDLRAMEALLDTWPTSNFEAPDVYPRWHFWLSRAISMGYFLRTHDAHLAPLD
ncbi:MAG TPA: asparagine synthase-related protein [Acidobacteriaceae bacterium]|jgi:asparagine synthase (glutamine-hydrolysing)|nr:asparagine synthase-related protein [Acidobacteriaceae bacterium]